MTPGKNANNWRSEFDAGKKAILNVWLYAIYDVY